MKVLHTADLHIGQRLMGLERLPEQELILNQILEIINNQEVNVLMISGDIFDVASPSQESIKVFYQFCAKLKGTECSHIVLTGGNHDGVNTLKAPKEIFEILNIYIFPNLEENLTKHNVHLKNSDGKLELIVSAVPFLRDKELNVNSYSSDILEIEQEIIKATQRIHSTIFDAIKEEKSVPKILMGHLFASGVNISDQDNEAERRIYAGNIGGIPLDVFTNEYDYIALGHIHSAQKVQGKEHIRYSGSPLKLSFSEKSDKSVYIIEFDELNHPIITSFQILQPRIIEHIHGNQKEFEKKLTQILSESNPSENFIPWITWTFSDVDTKSDIELLKNQFQEKYKILILKTIYINPDQSDTKFLEQSNSVLKEYKSVDEITPEKLFELLLEEKKLEDGHQKTEVLKALFQQVI